MSLTIIPAMDIKDSKVVRLQKGDFSDATFYSLEPAKQIQAFVESGATRIHMVDLDGAKSGSPSNLETMIGAIQDKSITYQIGGGVRSQETIDLYLRAGFSKVIIGTRAVLDRGFLKEVLSEWGDKIIVGVDAKNGQVATDGWTKIAKTPMPDLLNDVAEFGGCEIIYTDIDKDGMLEGPNVNAVRNISLSTKLEIIASGGISELNDIKALADINAANIIGVITGKALYEGRLDLAEAIKWSKGTSC